LPPVTSANLVVIEFASGYSAVLATTAAAAARPEITALSIVAGSPVWIQSPAKKKFGIGVSALGRSSCDRRSGAIVAFFSFSTNDFTTLAARDAGIIAWRSLITISRIS